MKYWRLVFFILFVRVPGALVLTGILLLVGLFSPILPDRFVNYWIEQAKKEAHVIGKNVGRLKALDYIKNNPPEE